MYCNVAVNAHGFITTALGLCIFIVASLEHRMFVGLSFGCGGRGSIPSRSKKSSLPYMILVFSPHLYQLNISSVNGKCETKICQIRGFHGGD
jgi:hypothetical protein